MKQILVKSTKNPATRFDTPAVENIATSVMIPLYFESIFSNKKIIQAAAW
jgi:hypothetical protein